MPDRPDRPVTPADLLALALRVQRDERAGRGEQLAEAERLRDALASAPGPPRTEAGRLLWLVEAADDPAIEQASRRARAALSLVGLIIVVLGLLSGIGIASAVFYYDGNAPVNVVAALGVFVVLQTFLLLMAVLAVMPRRWVGWLPGMDGVQEALRLASPGRLALLGARLLPQDLREALSAALGRSGAHQRVYGRVQLWAILRWSQLYALTVNLAAAAVFLYLVFFSDLAFGWSTTLKVRPATFYEIVRTLSLPWSFNDTLTPSLELVQRSRYYRGTPFSPEQRGAWWPFILTAMLVYGLVPRIAAFVIATWQLRKATGQALLATPGATELLHRLHEPANNTSNEDGDAASGGSAASMGSLGSRPVVIDWSRAAGSVARAVELLGTEPASFEPAGGSRSVADDKATLDAVGRSVGGDGVAVLVKLWEPPVIETTEFLRDLRRVIGERLPVWVVPVASDTAGRVIADDPVLAEQWRRRINAIGDPWTRVAEPAGLSAGRTEPADA